MGSKSEARKARKAAKRAREAQKAKALSGALPQETPRAVPAAQDPNAHPIFCFRYAAHRGTKPASFTPSPDDAVEIFEMCCEWGRSSWNELHAQMTGGKDNRHKKHHSQEIGGICSEGKNYIANQSLDAIFGDEIFRFRLSGEKRLWGFRLGQTFHVVFWDPNHEIYETETS